MTQAEMALTRIFFKVFQEMSMIFKNTLFFPLFSYVFPDTMQPPMLCSKILLNNAIYQGVHSYFHCLKSICTEVRQKQDLANDEQICKQYHFTKGEQNLSYASYLRVSVWFLSRFLGSPDMHCPLLRLDCKVTNQP